MLFLQSSRGTRVGRRGDLLEGVLKDAAHLKSKKHLRAQDQHAGFIVKGQLQGAKREQIKPRAIEALRSAAAIVEQKAQLEAPAYKAWLLQIANNVAEASKEGGFLGFGGVDVSDAEKATLSEIAAAIDTRT